MTGQPVAPTIWNVPVAGAANAGMAKLPVLTVKELVLPVASATLPVLVAVLLKKKVGAAGLAPLTPVLTVPNPSAHGRAEPSICVAVTAELVGPPTVNVTLVEL